MKRHVVLGSILAVGLLSAVAGAMQQAPAPAGAPAQGAGRGVAAPPSVEGLTVDRVKDNLYVIRGGGGNTAVFITAAGVTLVDTKIYGWAQPLMARLKEITDKPVTTIINTHTHYDHSEGNPDFPATVEVVTHENTARLMPEMRPVYGIANSGRNVFKDSGGRGVEYAQTVARAAALPIDTVITGHHNTTLGIADVKMYSEFIGELVSAVRAAKKAGQTIDDVVNTWKVPARFVQAGYAEPMPDRLKPNVEVIWKELN